MSNLHQPDRSKPISSCYERLRKIHPNWYVEWGRHDSDGWIPGKAFANAFDGRFQELLERIGMRMSTSDRKVIAASFALRFGWSAAAVVAPFLLEQCVPDVRLDNISLRFSETTFFEKVALRTARGMIVLHDGGRVRLVQCNDDDLENEGSISESDFDSLQIRSYLQAELRRVLFEQAEPVVDTLYAWARFSKRAIWGQITSSWGAQFVNIYAQLGRHFEALESVRSFFGEPPAFMANAQPRFYPVTHFGLTRIYHRRATCCLYFKLPQGNLCASCPLVGQEERVRRNKEWIDRSERLR
jgi:hypothetical protein